MKKKGILSASLLFLFSACLSMRAFDCFIEKTKRPGQPQRPEFYATQVVSEKDVRNGKDCLAAPDGRCAEILPGGQLVVLMEKTFIDIGTLVSKGETDYGLEGWFQVQDTNNESQNYAWILFWSGTCIPPGMWPGGFSFGPVPYPQPGLLPYGGTGVDRIRLTNGGTKSLFLDAVIGYGFEEEIR